MRKALIISLLSLIVISISFTGVMAKGQRGPLPHSGHFIADDSGLNNQLLNENINEQSRGPAPNSGDGNPDGSGWEDNWPNDEKPGRGPAPGSGDGISEGPEW